MFPKFILIPFLLFLNAQLTQAIVKCYSCKFSNEDNQHDDGHCLNIDKDNTHYAECDKCMTEINQAVVNNKWIYQLNRGCYDKTDIRSGHCQGEPASTEGQKCVCSSSFCNIKDLSFPCFSCAYSSNNHPVTIFGKTYKSDQTCLGKNAPTVQCHTRCFETYHEVPTDGLIVGVLVRDCEADVKHDSMKSKFGDYLQCSIENCNNKLPTNPILAPDELSSSTLSNNFHLMVAIFVSVLLNLYIVF